MQISKARLAAAAALTAITFGVLGAGTAYAYDQHLFSARNNLEQGLSQLQQTIPDKGGHRDLAIRAVYQAIDQINQGIQYSQPYPGR